MSDAGRMGDAMKWILGPMAVLAMASSARAIDVRNEDSRDYQLTITSSTMSRDLDLHGLTLSLVVCVGTCEFYVPGVGRATARGNDTVTIKNGRIVTTAKK